MTAPASIAATGPSTATALAVGIPLVQRLSQAQQAPAAPAGAGASGVAMSFASMFSPPSTSWGGSDPVAASPLEQPSAVAAGPATSSPGLSNPGPPSLTGPSLTVSRLTEPSLTVPRLTEPDLAAPTLAVPSLQRQSFDDAVAADQPVETTADTSTSPRTTDASTEPPAAPGPGATSVTGALPANASAPSADLDEMARRLYEPLVARLRAELWLDRERAGVFGDG
jgi:hypothetical protein